jgi:hypothetical protein
VKVSARGFSRWSAASLLAALAAAIALAGESDVKALVEQNRQLVEQVRAQQKQIDELKTRLDRLDETPGPVRPLPTAAESGRQIRLSGEVGVGFFRSGKDGSQPNSEFRVDDARIFIEASVWRNVYFFGGLELTTREANDEYFHVGELYVDVENLWSSGRDFNLSLRTGRFSIPFGEEYQVRNVIDNPLISHSLADIWGIDEGVQLYGKVGPVRYNLAVQNGGHKTLRDYDSDKAWTARLSLDATSRLAFSASAMRTGDLAVVGDVQSEVWFANAFFRAVGSTATTRTFGAELAELDAAYHWPTGHLKAAAGWVHFDDDSTAADYSRNLSYTSIEGVQRLSANVFAAARYSAIEAPRGYPLAGQGSAGKYFYNPFAPLTKDLQRLSLGLGYQFSPPLVWKFEYSWEDGHLVNGAKRNDEDVISTILGIRF